MDDNLTDARIHAPVGDPAVVVIDGVEVTSFDSVITRLRADYPSADVVRIETILLREWEAFTAGRPTVVPTAVEEGAREILDQRPR